MLTPVLFVPRRLIGPTLVSLSLLCCPVPRAIAQDRLPTMPGYDTYTQALRRRSPAQEAIQQGNLFGNWVDGGKALEYTKAGKAYRFDFATNATTELAKLTEAPANNDGRRRFGFPGPGRGRQFAESTSPNGMRRAIYKDSNLFIGDAEGKNPVAVTTDGNREKRIKYGTASWVYGEELAQNTAFWWSPDSKKLAYYRFDESQVRNYFLALDQTKVQSRLDDEAYPKSGAPNPIVDLFIYDLDTKQTVRVDVRDGQPFSNDIVGHYVYRVQWSPDGKQLLFVRSNRKQNTLAFTACDPATGRCRTLVQEENPTGWVSETLPNITFLADGQRFLVVSERNGFRNFYLYDLTGKLLNTITQHPFDVQDILRVDEKAGVLFYTAHSGDNPHKLQLHRVGLDGKNDIRLTAPTLHHRVNLAPDGKHFLDIAQAHDVPPMTQLIDDTGKVLATLAQADPEKVKAAGFIPNEGFTFKAADGKTDLYGTLSFPSNFDPKRKYPLLVQVYGGPETSGANENYQLPAPLAEYGFLVARFDGRGGNERGRAFKDMMYRNFGIVEIDDQAAGVKFLRQRPYVDGTRVGIEGTSYGGYASVMSLLRYPDVFQAACACSSVTDWHNYDSTYTERYMGLPQDNASGYQAGSAMTYAENLKGRLMLYFGTADNNVHPSNTLQLIAALQRAGKSFEVQVGPDMEHTAVDTRRMMEFFIENLVLRPRASTP